MIQEYVLIFTKTDSGEILIIEKDRPLWMKGLLNMPGGHIEQGESPEETTVRELFEESGLICEQVECLGLLKFPDCKIHVMQVFIPTNQSIAPRPEETERVYWTNWKEIKENNRMIPNLKIILPLCICGVKGWTLEEGSDSIRIIF